MTLTSDSPASVVSSRALSLALENTPVDPPSGLSFVAEPGFTLTGAVGDLETLTISGQDFGTKAPPRHFDRIDRYWANGTEYPSPYGSISDGDVLKVGSGYPFLGTQGADLSGWRFRAEAARHGRALGYQIESDASGPWKATVSATQMMDLRDGREPSEILRKFTCVGGGFSATSAQMPGLTRLWHLRPG